MIEDHTDHCARQVSFNPDPAPGKSPLRPGVAYECVQAMVCFNSEGSALGAKAICYLSRDPSGTVDVVVFALNGCDPTQKYKGKNKPSKTQLVAGELASQKRRSDELGFQVKRTQKENDK